MLFWAAIFLIMSVSAALVGFGGTPGMIGDVAQVVFFIFLVLCAASVLTDLLSRRWPRGEMS